MGTSPLSIEVYVAPMRPYTCPDRLGQGEDLMSSPQASREKGGLAMTQSNWINVAARSCARAFGFANVLTPMKAGPAFEGLIGPVPRTS